MKGKNRNNPLGMPEQPISERAGLRTPERSEISIAESEKPISGSETPVSAKSREENLETLALFTAQIDSRSRCARNTPDSDCRMALSGEEFRKSPKSGKLD